MTSDTPPVQNVNNFGGTNSTTQTGHVTVGHEPASGRDLPRSQAANEQVFLSYSHLDVSKAELVAAGLRGREIQVWMDRTRLVGGDNWQSTIEQSLGSCRAVVILLSQQAVSRGWTEHQAEMVQAGVERMKRQLLMVPARLNECHPPAIPVGQDGERLTDLHQVDLFPNLDEGLDRLADALTR